MGQPNPQEWLSAYAKIQRVADRDILRLIEQSEKDIQAQIRRLESLAKRGVGSTVRQYQLSQIRAAMLREQARIFRTMARYTTAKKFEAAEAAIRLQMKSVEDLFASVGRPELAAQLGQALNHGITGSLEVMRVRMNQSRVDLAERIYKTNEWMDGRVETKIASALARGLSAREFAAEATDWFNPNTPGGVRYAALRLARTEINNAFHAMAVNAADQPWVKGMQWHLSRSHPKPDECDEYARKDPDNLGPGRYKVKNVPKKPHPHCFCFVTPIVVEEEEFFDDFIAGKYDKDIDSALAGSGRSIPIAKKAVPKRATEPVAKKATTAPKKSAQKLTPKRDPLAITDAQRRKIEAENERLAKARKAQTTPKPSTGPGSFKPPNTSAKRAETHSRLDSHYNKFGQRLRMPPLSQFSEGLGKSLDQLGRLPQHVHDKMLRYFQRFDRDSGIYLGRGASTQVGSPHFARLSGVHPRGWPANKTWDDVDAGCSCGHKSKQVAIGDSRYRGDQPEAVHELFHMVDDTLGEGLSWTDGATWRDAANEVSKELKFNPYFTASANPSGWYSELFAEFGSGWSETQAIGNVDERLRIIAVKYLGASEASVLNEAKWARVRQGMMDLLMVIERAAK